jgi:hypothetical protein
MDWAMRHCARRGVARDVRLTFASKAIAGPMCWLS